MAYLKINEKIELSIPTDTGYGSTSKMEKAKFVNKYLFNSDEFEKIKKKINELNKDTAFDLWFDINSRLEHAHGLIDNINWKETTKYIKYIWLELKKLQIQLVDKIKNIE